MSAIIQAFIQYSISLIFCVAVAAAGIICGKKLHDKDVAKKNADKAE